MRFVTSLEVTRHPPLAMRWAEECGVPRQWLKALPLVSHGFDLTRREFYDALMLVLRLGAFEHTDDLCL